MDPRIRHVEIDVRADATAVSLAAAEEFIRLAGEAISLRGKFLVALAGGSTPKKMYQLLASSPRKERVDWSRIEFFFGDERAVPAEHADSNFRMAREALLEPLAIDPARVHRMAGEAADLVTAASQYQREMADVTGAVVNGWPPALDLLLAGMGQDGHTLSLFPKTDALRALGPWVVANNVPQLNTSRLTLTSAVATRARQVLFLVAGGEKAQALAAVLQGPYLPNEYPAQLIAGRKVNWLVDQSAAAELQPGIVSRPRAIRPVKLAPSILAADFTRLGEQIQEVVDGGADRIHIDVMDGHFVPNISFGPLVVKAARKITYLPLECHLMINDPDKYLGAFVEAGASSILVHVEGAPHLHRTLQRIRALDIPCGVVLNPSTPASQIVEVLPDVDLVLVMTVNPGYGGQQFITNMLPKISQVRELIEEHNPNCELEVDGGIDRVTTPQVVDAGADVLVAGSAIFGAKEGAAAALYGLRGDV